MSECASECARTKKKCKNKECRLWIKHKEDLNCTLIAIHRHGAMTLHEVAERLEMSYVRVKQIQDSAIKKIDKETMGGELFDPNDGFF